MHTSTYSCLSGAQQLNRINLSFIEHEEVQKTDQCGEKKSFEGDLRVLKRRLKRLRREQSRWIEEAERNVGVLFCLARKKGQRLTIV